MRTAWIIVTYDTPRSYWTWHIIQRGELGQKYRTLNQLINLVRIIVVQNMKLAGSYGYQRRSKDWFIHHHSGPAETPEYSHPLFSEENRKPGDKITVIQLRTFLLIGGPSSSSSLSDPECSSSDIPFSFLISRWRDASANSCTSSNARSSYKLDFGGEPFQVRTELLCQLSLRSERPCFLQTGTTAHS